jgi:hypothetical protein
VTEISEVAIKYTLAVDCLGLPASGALDPHLDPQMLAAGTLASLVQKCKYSRSLPWLYHSFFFFSFSEPLAYSLDLLVLHSLSLYLFYYSNSTKTDAFLRVYHFSFFFSDPLVHFPDLPVLHSLSLAPLSPGTRFACFASAPVQFRATQPLDRTSQSRADVRSSTPRCLCVWCSTPRTSHSKPLIARLAPLIANLS